jgi:predicted nuclease with TOPRIM domain
LPQKETSDSLRRQIDELRVEAARLLSESEKTKRAAEKLAERIKRIEKTAL